MDKTAIELMADWTARNEISPLTKKAFCEEIGISVDRLNRMYAAEIRAQQAEAPAIDTEAIPTHWEADPGWRCGKVCYTIPVAVGRYYKCRPNERNKILDYMDIDILRTEEKAGHIRLLYEGKK